jgi:hypothetical protein
MPLSAHQKSFSIHSSHLILKLFMQAIPAPGIRFQYDQRIGDNGKSWLRVSEGHAITGWIIEQLSIQPYQHILEVGYRNGNNLREVANKLKVGFIAGVDDSVAMLQQATRKNQKLIDQELIQLHLGSIADLAYPSHYFHSIYTSDTSISWQKCEYRYMQLHSLLKTGGRFVTVFQTAFPVNEKDIWSAAEKIQVQYAEAGFGDVSLAFREMHTTTAIAVVGFKQ